MVKNKKHISFFSLIITLSLLTSVFSPSCTNKDGPPGYDKEEIINSSLPVAQYMLAIFQSKEFGRTSNIWAQQLAGVDGTYARIDKYDIDASYLDYSWEYIYFIINYNLDIVIENASEINYISYIGIAKILKAYLFSIATDVFDKMPFNSAGEYVYGGEPSYDSQELIYEGINNLILDGISLLQSAINNNSKKPGDEVDYIYGGNLGNWIKAANVLRLRTTLKISHQDQNYNHALIYLNEEMFSSNADNMFFPFDIHEDLPNPYYEFDRNVSSIRVGKKLADLLKSNEDPRLKVFLNKDSNNGYSGSGPGEADKSTSFIGPAIASKTSPVYLITFAEQKFIEAEVLLRAGQVSNAINAYKEGIAASLEQFDVYDEDWYTINIDNTESVTLNNIIEQKYIAMFTNPEVWADWRRTSYPTISVAAGSHIGNKHPRRFPYPSRENIYNSNNVPSNVSITDRVWWDVNY